VLFLGDGVKHQPQRIIQYHVGVERKIQKVGNVNSMKDYVKMIRHSFELSAYVILILAGQ
jgi:hypothetical protein